MLYFVLLTKSLTLCPIVFIICLILKIRKTMKTIKLLFLSTLLVLISSCAFEYDDNPYSNRSFEKTYSLLKKYVIVNEHDQYELIVDQKIIDSLMIRPDHISRIQTDLLEINQKVLADMNDPNCVQVIMSTETQGVMVKKSDPSLKYEISSEEEFTLRSTREQIWMSLQPNNGNSRTFTSTAQVRTDLGVTPGWGTYYINFASSTGKMSSGSNRISWSGSGSINYINYWYANNPNGSNTQWTFTSGPLGSGANGSVVFSPQ